MRITIVGGGNIGTQFAVHCAESGHKVTVFTSTPELFDLHLEIVDEHGVITHEGTILGATDDAEIAFRHAELILVTVPANGMEAAAQSVYAHSDKKAVIGVVPGNGGSECAFRRCIERGNVFFNIERVPAIARLIQKGKTVRSTGYRSELRVAALPGREAARCADLISGIFHIPAKTVPCLLNLTLTPSNPILHTSRLFCLFQDWREGRTYPAVPLFYEDWDDASSELLLRMDEETQRVCRALPELDLTHVISLKKHYQAKTAEAMSRKIRSIPAFHGLRAPILTVDGGLVPDLHSRYFTADFSFGLHIFQQVAQFAEVPTPCMDRVMNWYRKIAVVKKEFSFQAYGITDRGSLARFYLT